MAKFRKKPVVVDAIRWTGKNTQKVKKFCSYNITRIFDGRKVCALLIHTLEGNMTANKGDWIIRGVKGVKGEYYSCKPDIFELTYEKVK